MNGLTLRRPMPHGKNDIGWREGAAPGTLHWFMSTRVASVAISHCGEVFSKGLLTYSRKSKLCTTCQIIESMREELDGKNVR